MSRKQMRAHKKPLEGSFAVEFSVSPHELSLYRKTHQEKLGKSQTSAIKFPQASDGTSEAAFKRKSSALNSQKHTMGSVSKEKPTNKNLRKEYKKKKDAKVGTEFSWVQRFEQNPTRKSLGKASVPDAISTKPSEKDHSSEN